MESAIGLLGTAEELLKQLYQRHEELQGLEDEINSMEADLRPIKEAIKYITKWNLGMEDQDGSRSWLADLRKIRDRIQDCLDLYDLKITSEHNEESKLTGLLHTTARHIKTWRDRANILEEIKTIMKLSTKAKERRADHDQGTDTQQAGQATAAQSNTSVEAQPKGLVKPINKIVELLKDGIDKTKDGNDKTKDGNDKTKELTVIAIAGLGGSGKSVLAHAAYNQVREKFDCKATVVASNGANKLLTDMLRDLGGGEPTSPHVGHDLKTFLCKKRYIILIEDLQTPDCWSEIRLACPAKLMGSRIIVTTTNDAIARMVTGNLRSVVYKMQPLDQDAARQLLQTPPSNLDEGLNTIVEACGYLPLAIVCMAQYMTSIETHGSIHYWNKEKCEDTCKLLGSLLDDKTMGYFRKMKQVLSHIYNSLLDRNVTDCLLSLSAYPKDHVIKSKSQLRRWLAERLVVQVTKEDQARRDDHVAQACFQTLVDHNIIIPEETSINGSVKRFRVHRMMLEFIRRPDFEDFISEMPTESLEGDYRDIRRLCLRNSSDEPPRIGQKVKVDLTYLRSLTFFGKPSKEIMDFTNYPLMQSLDLEKCTNLQDDDLHNVYKLRMLRYLSIRGNGDVTMLPKKIGKLRRLETLDIRDTKVDTLPKEVIQQLPKLTHLFGQFKITYHQKKSKNIIISKLQTLAGFCIDESPGFVNSLPNIDMPRLSKVKIFCRQTAPTTTTTTNLISSLKKWLGKEHSPPKSFSLRSLSFDSGTVCDLDFLEELDEVPVTCHLSSLKLRGKLTNLPRFIHSAAMDTLQELCLSGTNLGWEVLSELQGLQYLLYFKLTEEDTFVSNTNEEFIWRSGWFENLKRLYFDVPKLPKIVIKEKAMQRLESLQLFCAELGGFSGIKRLNQLQEVILPDDVTGEVAEDLQRQVETHPMMPEFRKKQHPTRITMQKRLTRTRAFSRPASSPETSD